jgi:hypothetical protein
MKNLFFLLLFSLTALGAAAQKIAVSRNLITVNRQPYARIEPGGETVFGVSDMYYVSSLQNERLFVVKYLTLSDPATSSPGNPTGSTGYVQFVFTAARLYVEMNVPASGFRTINIARIIYAARLLKDDKLDPQAVADFAVNNGTPFSARLQVLSQPLLVPAGGY